MMIWAGTSQAARDPKRSARGLQKNFKLQARPAWLGTAATTLYLAGAVAAISAVLTGQQAAATVFLPGMAHPLVTSHRSWALATAGYASVLACGRIVASRLGVPRVRLHRVLLLVAGLAGVLLVQQTAERGARLVYEQGVGVIAAP
jgi:uncharacterized membrane protein